MSSVCLLLSIRCINTKILDDSGVISTGLFSSMRNLVHRHPVAKKERRRIVVLQSAFFEPSSRQPNMLLYNEVYQSETFNDVVDLSPNLLADLYCRPDKDCKIRVNVMYSSSLTGSKEIMLVGGVFSLRELAECNTNVLTIAMTGMHCEEALCFAEIVPPFPLAMTVAVPMSVPRKSANPISHKFLFYSDAADPEKISPVVNVEEQCWEPRFAAKIPLLFFQNEINSLTHSIAAWTARRELERFRQGLFTSDEESYQHQWCVLSVSVLGARFTPVSIQEHIQRTGSIDSKKVLANRAVSLTPTSHVNVSDDLKLSSFVEAKIDDKSVPFAIDIGRTNTEYAINEPVYGSNINGQYCRKKGGKQFSTSESGRTRLISVPKKYSFNCVENVGSSSDKPSGTADISKASVVTMDGTANAFATYVSSNCDSTLRILLFVEHENKSICLGCGTIPVDVGGVDGNQVKDIWVPITLNKDAAGFCLAASVHVVVLLKCNTDQHRQGTECQTDPQAAGQHSEDLNSNPWVGKWVAPNSMTKVLGRNHAMQAQQSRRNAIKNTNAGNKDTANSMPPPQMQESVNVRDPAAVIADCYAWLWPIGYSGTDPMGFKPEDPTPTGATLTSLEDEACLRTDVMYSPTWITKHIQSMVAMKDDIVALYGEMHAREVQQQRWRASSLKKIKEVQGLPTNLLMQIMLVREHGHEGKEHERSSANTTTSFSGKPVKIINSMTCGAPSPHWCGHKAGGLDQLDDQLLKHRVQLEYLKDQYMNVVGDATGLSSDGAAAKLSKRLCNATMEYEEFTLSVAKRRFLATSQALSILVNGIIMKLSLVMEQYIAPEIASDWLLHGFLIVFESLLSVTLDERSMLEDCMGAIDNLKLYTVRIVVNPGPCGEPYAATCAAEHQIIYHDAADHLTAQTAAQDPSAGPVAAEAEVAVPAVHDGHLMDPSLLEEVPKGDGSAAATARAQGSSTQAQGFPSSYELPNAQSLFYESEGAFDYSPSNKGIDVEIHGREVLLKLSEALITLLPPSFRGTESDGVTLKIVPVLFSQGIDIVQSVASTFSRDSGNKNALSANDLQHYVNMKGLKAVNDYCWLYKPGTSGGTAGGTAKPGLSKHIHPLCEQLDDRVRYSDIKMKDVEMLLEIERLCLLLNGCRVTLCKSGKDRTGMAVTLEEARLLGELYHCGESTDHIMHNANILREFGCRIDVCEKNVGRRVYSINSIQTQFLPMLYRPPTRYLESVLKKDNS